MPESALKPVRVVVSDKKPAAAAVDVLVVPVWSGRRPLFLPSSLERVVRQRLRQLSFSSHWGSAELFPLSVRGVTAPFIAVVGMGDSNQSVQRQAEGLRRGVARVVQEARRHGLRRMALSLVDDKADSAVLAAAAVDGAILASYRYTDFSVRGRKEDRARGLRHILLLTESANVSQVRNIARREQAILSGVTLARNLVNRPASEVTPAALVQSAREIARTSARISTRIFNRAEAAQHGLNAFLAVARGSKEEPYFIHLTYTPSRRNRAAPGEKPAKIFLVGKGITFDSGGLSLKPAEAMEAMKIDMAGAAAVLGVFSVLAELQSAVEVHGLIAACENMPSGEAYRPGDILTAKNGTTIEVLNTDAEGRVTLADALSYAAEESPDAIVDLATLTGACMVALGETYAGLWGTDDSLARQLLAAASSMGEGVTQLPLPDEYRSSIESRIADTRNMATMKWGGAITAALFLREFVGDVPWAHLDIAGPSFAERDLLPYNGTGGTGFGVRTLLSFLEHYTAADA